MSTYLAVVSFNGTDYPVPFDDHEWIVQGGFHAPVQGWVMPKETCDAILAALAGATGVDREVSLKLGEPDDPLEVNRVVVLGSAPADNPQRRILIFSDVRWYFTRAWMCMDVNVKRRMGDTRLIGGLLQTLDFTSEIADTIEYAPWTINNGAPYEWGTFKDQVLTYLVTATHGRPTIAFVTDVFSVLTIADKIVEKTVTDAPGHVALANAIHTTPGASIYVDLDGKIHVYESTPGAEASAIAALPAAFEGHGGDIALADKSGLRPASASTGAWRVYVDWEVEVRFTYNASATGLWATLGANDPFLIPVLQVTDQQLTIPAGTYYGGIVRTGSDDLRTVGQGSWITQAEAFAAWGGTSYGTLTLPALTDDIVARHYCGDTLQRYVMGETVVSANPVWANRIQEVMRCYRTFFRVNPKFWDKIRHAWAIRAAIWDPVTGQRAPATCYHNFRLIPVDRWASPAISTFGVNVTTSYPAAPHEGLLAYGTPNGFHVKIVDKELGVIAIDRNALSKYPGHAKITHSPVSAVTEAKIDGASLSELALEELVLSSGDDAWKLAVVFSVSPAAPNDKRRLYEIPVTMEEAQLAAGMTGGVLTGYGPDKELRSHLSQARVAWRDDTGTYDEILRLLGCSDSTVAIDRANETTPIGLTPINLEQELKPLARAMAAADLLSKLDCYEGRRAVPMNDALHPIGSLRSVTHKVLDNRAVSVVSCSGDAESFSAIDFLSGSARAYLLQELKAAKR